MDDRKLNFNLKATLFMFYNGFCMVHKNFAQKVFSEFKKVLKLETIIFLEIEFCF